MIAGARAVAFTARAISRLTGRLAISAWRLAERLQDRRPEIGRIAVRLALVAAAAAALAAGREDA